MGVTVREKVKGSGIFWVFIRHAGQRRAKCIGPDEELAQEVAKKIRAKIELGEFGFKGKLRAPSFGKYAKEWIEKDQAARKPSTVRDYQGLLDTHILPVFGSRPVNAITRKHVKQFLAGKAKECRKVKGRDGERIVEGYNASTVQHMKNIISLVLQVAIDDEVLQSNPAWRLGKFMKQQSSRLEADPLTRQELTALLEAFRKDWPAHYPLALTLARTGMRIGEALALRWEDVDFHGGFIRIRHGISRGRLETPKSGKSRRVVMSRQLSEALAQLRARRREWMLRTVHEPDEGRFRLLKYKGEAVRGWKEFPEWVFISDQGNPLDSSSWRRRIFEKALERAGLRRIRVHDLRHSYASFLIQAGESLAFVRDQLGHHSIKVTVDIYGHLAPEGNRAAVDRLDDDAKVALCVNAERQPVATQAQPKTAKGLAIFANPLHLLAGPMGFEPTPSDVTGRRYNQT
jgi:integrase